MMTINDLTYLIREAAFRVHSKLGSGLFESVYQKALIIELEKIGLGVKSEVPINLFYDGIELGLGFRIDIIVEDTIIMELKSTNKINNSDH